MQICSPSLWISSIDIVDRATSIGHSENHVHGALVSIDLNCPADLFKSRRKLVVQLGLSFTTLIQDGFRKYITIQNAEVGYFRADNDIGKMLDNLPNLPLRITETFKDGRAGIEIPQPDDDRKDDFGNIRIMLILDAYPSNMELSVSLSTCVQTSADGNGRSSRTFPSAILSYTAPSPNEERYQKLLSWAAGLGYEKLFAAYLDQEPSILDMEDKFGMTPFSWAAFAGQASIIQRAFQQGNSRNARGRTARGFSPLEVAASNNESTIFELFLKYLKYFEEFDGEIPEHSKLHLFKLDDKDVEKELKLAVDKERPIVVERLVRMLLDRQDKNKEEAWLARKMIQAAKEGALCLVQVLKDCGAEVHTEIEDENENGNEQKTTPLMAAITHNQIAVAEFLISHDAGDENALRTAVQRGQHKTIRALLQAGIQVTGNFKQELHKTATDNRDSTTLMLLELEKGTGKLATYKLLDKEVDKLFESTVVEFVEDEGPTFKELSVHELMWKPDRFFSITGKTKFKWFHLPANNMRWAEALIGKIHHKDPSLAYKVLEPKRWVKRQHEGESGSPHARFMMPACHDFSEAFKAKKSKKIGSDKNDKHLVLFMPYLHWDEEETMKKRSQFIATYPKSTVNETTGSSKEEKLLKHYLLSGNNGDMLSRHVLHIRRTLDQYQYHNLKDTVIRDADQAIHRYQKDLKERRSNESKEPEKEEPLTVVMVDQLWLWILVGPSGRAETVVTCFPSRDWSDVGINIPDDAKDKSILDRRRTTDVLQITKSYIQQRPNAVRTPYDLAGVIASRCSRALLDHSTDMLNFAEVYENSISDIRANVVRIISEKMNEETLLFNRFNSLMQTRTNTVKGLREIEEPKSIQNPQDEKKSKIASSSESGETSETEKSLNDESKAEEVNSYQELAMKIWEDVEWLRSPEQKGQKRPDNAVEHCRENRKCTLETEIPSLEDIDKLETKMSDEEGKEHLIKLLEKFGRFYVLDITREITLLSQIKDIQDELEMMGKIFAEQNDVLETMDRIIHIMEQPNSDASEDMRTGNLDPKSQLQRFYNGRKTKKDYSEELHDDLSIYGDSNGGSVFGDVYPLASITEPQKENNTVQSMVWDLGHQKQNLPLRTVRRHSEQVQKMIRRAKSTNEALSSLVELKQKQNNMIDTRTARLHAEQAHLMTLEAEEQSKTLMVFTIVTIVFLPLSFIAAFFAIPVKEFNDTLTLGFVSKITFPASVAISLLFIVVGFIYSRWRLKEAMDRTRNWFNSLWNKVDRGPNKSDDRSLVPMTGITVARYQ